MSHARPRSHVDRGPGDYGRRATIAYMLPSSCLVYEQELARVIGELDGVVGVPARLLIEETGAGGLQAMNEHVELAARQLATVDPDVLAYMCTSGSFMHGNHGDEDIKRALAATVGCAVTSTATAAIAALRRLGLARVAMLTPYDEDLTMREVEWLASNDVEVVDLHFRDIPDNLDRGAQPPDDLFALADRLRWRDADGIFLSCGNVRYLEIIERLEAHTGKPVLASGPATTWMALRMAGVTEPLDGHGSLFRLGLEE